MSTTLNKNESAVMRAFNDDAFAEGGDHAKGEWGIEVDHVHEMIAGNLDVTPKTAKGIFTSLKKKDMFIVEDTDDGEWATLTQTGMDTIKEFDDMSLEIDDEPEPKKAKAKRELKTAAKKDMKSTHRTSHADCDHAKSGSEGKKARAKCRRDRAAAGKEKANA